MFIMRIVLTYAGGCYDEILRWRRYRSLLRMTNNCPAFGISDTAQ